jgi:hypothetical protein
VLGVLARALDRTGIRMPHEIFPSVPCGEFTITRPFTAPGLFAYRHMQAEGLLQFPDFGGGDMNDEQRKEALIQMVNVHRPLAALVLFLGVVGLEDFIRDIGARLADVRGLEQHFAEIGTLRPILKKNPLPYARQDKDPAPLSDWNEVNELYKKALGVVPIDTDDLPKLHDLALIRHTVAHHAALVRPIDVPRFQYWEIQPNSLINPPANFVRETLMHIYRTGQKFESAVADRLFKVTLAAELPNWYESPSDLVLTLIETFNWFGKLITDNSVPLFPGDPNYENKARARNTAIRNQLNQLCINELMSKHAI